MTTCDNCDNIDHMIIVILAMLNKNTSVNFKFQFQSVKNYEFYSQEFEKRLILSNNMMELRFTTIKLSKVKLGHDGFLYNEVATTATAIRWRCEIYHGPFINDVCTERIC